MTLAVDVLVVGAGPAGCCAALRLRDLGYEVALLEKRAFPRPQVGESLSPGIWNLLAYLGLDDQVRAASFLSDLPARVAWTSAEAELRTTREPGLMVDRGRFDALLLEQARQRGVVVLQPAKVRRQCGNAGDWRIEVEARQAVTLRARLIVDATGRHGHRAGERTATSVPTLAP